MQNTPQLISSIAQRIPAVIPHLNANALAAIKAGGYKGIRDTYWAEIYDSVYDYLVGDKPVTSYRNKMSKAMADAFVQAGELGYEEGGGELPMDNATLVWLGEAQTTELENIANLFSRLKQEWDGLDPINEAYARADGYTATLDSIRAQAKIMAGKGLFQWVLGSTEKHCATCAKLANGKFRPAKWYVQRGYIPRLPGASMECGGYNCDCTLIDKNGNEWSE